MGKKIQIKNVDVLKAIIRGKWDPMLIEIVLWQAGKYGICITEGWRPALRPGDVHHTDPLRGYDSRSWFYAPHVAEIIEKEINERWEYDYKRPEKNCAWIHESFDDQGKSRGVHFHIQVHPNTRKRVETYGEVPI